MIADYTELEAPQQRLYLRPLSQGHGALRPILARPKKDNFAFGPGRPPRLKTIASTRAGRYRDACE
jgi:hypothetical protein